MSDDQPNTDQPATHRTTTEHSAADAASAARQPVVDQPTFAAPPPERLQPSSNPVLRRTLKWGALLALAIAVVGAVLGGIFAGGVGVTSALVGTAMALVFVAITAVSILVANRFVGSDLYVPAFFGIVLGAWLVKFIVFIVLAVILRAQPWINPFVLFLTVIVAIVGSLVVNVVVVARSRMPYASDARPATRVHHE